MTISDINSYVTFRTGADTTAFPAATRLYLTNRWYHKVAVMILTAMGSADFDDANRTDYPEVTTNLVASQQDYTLPTTALRLKRVEAKLDGSTWYPVTPFDLNDNAYATDTTSVARDFSVQDPYYDLTANAIKLYPIPASNVTAGLKIWYSREVAEFTSGEVSTGTKEPGFDEPFHVMVALGICYDWFAAKDPSPTRLNPILAELAEYEARLKKHYQSKITSLAWDAGSPLANQTPANPNLFISL